MGLNGKCVSFASKVNELSLLLVCIFHTRCHLQGQSWFNMFEEVILLPCVTDNLKQLRVDNFGPKLCKHVLFSAPAYLQRLNGSGWHSLIQMTA